MATVEVKGLKSTSCRKWQLGYKHRSDAVASMCSGDQSGGGIQDRLLSPKLNISHIVEHGIAIVQA